MSEFQTKKANPTFSSVNYYLLITAISTLVVLPIYFFGIPFSRDALHHFQTSANLSNLLTTHIFPLWSDEANNGYGGIVLRFYPILSYAVLSFADFLGGDLFNASILAFLFWTVLGGLGVYLWANEHFSKQAALFASVCYIFSPYHVSQLYIGFLYAEFAASAILPFCFWFIDRIYKNKSWSDVSGFGFFYALLILTHIPLTFIGTISLLAYCVFRKEFISNLIKSAAGFLLGALIGIFQWSRVLSEMNWVGISLPRFSTTGFYNYKDTFLLSFPYIFGSETDNHVLWFLDLILLFTCAFAVSFLLISKKKLFHAKIVFILTIFFATPFSRLVWDNFGLLPKVQFPWRWLSILSIISVIFFASGFETFIESAKQKNRAKFYILSGFVLFYFSFTVFQCIKQAQFYEKPAIIQMSENIAGKENFEEWLPIWANPETSKIKERVIIENRRYEILDWKSDEKIIHFDKGNESKVRIATFYYPHWKAFFDDGETKIEPSEDGAISVIIPSEEKTLKLKFIEPVQNIILFYFTIISLCFVGLLLIGGQIWKTSLKSKI
jgi:6-pyruvoyl-tetrahydropterin synthase related domain